MKAKHTQGPWTFGQVRNTGIYDIIGADVTGKGREIVGDFRASQSRNVNDSNAALIAAAPELLAACKAALEAYRNEDYDDYFDGERLEALLEIAIEKAEGNQ